MNVIMRMRENLEHRAVIPILHERYCQHGETICGDCVESWAIDWYIFYRQTTAGIAFMVKNMNRNYPRRYPH